MVESSFLQLPTELLIRILTLCEFSSVLACQLANRFLADVIKNSIELQYRREAYIAGADEDAIVCGRTTSDRLDALRTRERAWLAFKSDFRERIEVPHKPTGIYDLTAGMLLLGDSSMLPQLLTTGLRYVMLPTAMSFQPTEWATVDMPPGRSIVDIGLCVYEHDMLAIVTSTPDLDGLMYSLDINLLHASTRAPHSEAQQPTFQVCKLNRRAGRLAIAIEIVGDHLALVVSFPFATTVTAANLNIVDRFFLFEWRTGALKLDHRGLKHSMYCGIIFLSTDVVMLPNMIDASIDVWRIAPEREIRKLVSLGLPARQPHATIRSMTCRSEPNPYTRRAPTSLFFPSVFYDPAEALVTFNVYGEADGDHFIRNFSFISHRRSFLETIRPYDVLQSSESPNEAPPVLPWEEWGPNRTRWFTADEISTRWITVAAGQRCVMIGRTARREASPMLVMDFNPHHVRAHNAQMARDELSHKLDSSEALSELMLAASPPAGMEGADHPPDSVDGDSTPSDQASSSDDSDDDEEDEEDDEDDEDDGDDDDSGDGSDSGARPDNALEIWCVAHEEELHPQGIFLAPIRSSLPYLLYASPESYRYDGVLLDEERILGVRIDSQERMTIDVFHYGATSDAQP